MPSHTENTAHPPQLRASELLAQAGDRARQLHRHPGGDPADAAPGNSSGTSQDPFGASLFEGYGTERPAPIEASTPEPARSTSPSSRPVFSSRSSARSASAGGAPGNTKTAMNPNRPQPTERVLDRSLDPPWADAKRPAGSGFSAEEWQATRQGGKYHVIELLSGKERGLITIPAQKTGPGSAWGITVGQAFDGCMLVGPGAKPSHPNHIRSKAVLVTDKEAQIPTFCYGIIEPAEMVNEWGRGASITLTGKNLFEAPEDALVMEPEEVAGAPGASLRERQR